MRILFVTSNRVGDAVLSTGLLAHLISRHPGARITVVCGAYARDVFSRMPNRERTLILNKRRFDLHWLPLWRWAAVRRWDMVVDLRGSALAYMVRARQRAVLSPRPGDESRPKVVQLARVLDLDPPPRPVAWVSDADEAVAESLLPDDRPLVALGPTANWAPKIWPAERFVALFRGLRDSAIPHARAVVLAGPGEAERRLAARVVRALPEAIDLSGRLILPQAAACLRRCALFVGNDSGLMHLAASAGTPTLGLFGPTPMAQYAPSGAHTAAISGGPAMEDLSVTAVLAAGIDLLERCRTPERLRSVMRAGWTPSEAALHEAALNHLARYSSTRAGLCRVLNRRIDRWIAQQPERPPDADIAAARAAVTRIVERLAEFGAVNDEAFAEARARRLIRSGHSGRAVAAHLAARGIDPEIRRAAATMDAEQELAAAMKLAWRRRIGPFRNAPPGEGTDRREQGILARAGFSQDVARRVLGTDADTAEEILRRLKQE